MLDTGVMPMAQMQKEKRCNQGLRSGYVLQTKKPHNAAICSLHTNCAITHNHHQTERQTQHKNQQQKQPKRRRCAQQNTHNYKQKNTHTKQQHHQPKTPTPKKGQTIIPQKQNNHPPCSSQASTKQAEAA